MAKRTTTKEAPALGRCSFCQEEFAKNKMTQHLKSCAARQAIEARQTGEKERLLHLQVEGRYRPEYWMHVEIPAAATLADLDGFLRYVWLECCGHLSEFEIDKVSYSHEAGDDWGMGLGGLSLVDQPGADEEGEDEEGMPDMQEIASEMSKQLALEFQTDLKNVPTAEIEKKLEQMFAESMPPGMSANTLPMLRPLLSHMADSLQQGTLGEELAEIEEEDEEDEGGMMSELGEVLEVGKKFSYVYDFGSSSTLTLRVLNEREGAMLHPEADEEEALEDEEVEEVEDEDEDLEDDELEDGEDEEGHIHVIIMARNEAPALVCHICGKPATQVPSGSEYTPLAEVALCETHAAKSEDPDDLLPIVNSPRTGICGYTGDEEEEWDEDEDWDEDEEE